ncbi:GNAT family N-acetyltransferase [Mycobacterium sp. RTGN5]|uniref:GNAT family N-acetyltransferase n=1 Tax=Mycobacterium sp. RTGN5 TaxID=3016522 RepID=UPI0029C8861D|nr:GNAT family N-acetyltransferase [Mycobacterium sp. RTGN5]
MVEVRDATADDAMAMAQSHVRSWQAGYRGLIAQDYLDGLLPEVWASRYSFDSERSGRHSLVAVDGDAICGHVTFGRSPDDELAGSAEVWALYVDPPQWGAGIGGALVDAACARLSEAGHERALLWALSANTRARRFYERMGWRADGRERTDAIDGNLVDEVRYVTALGRHP